ncbi:MAG TPA: transcriptional regulator [Desulfosporosinus sp.]|nr:transcriptional regulator [Desulfosporosinus sp.]
MREQVTVQVKRLMIALGNETLSAKELLERLRLKHRPTLSNNYLRPALELGLIEMTVPDKPNSSRQKYRIKKIK